MSIQVQEKKIPLLVIEGPTSAGKSDAAVLCAKALSGEIISADSMQVYIGMDIGTGKVTPEEMDGVSHFMIDVADPANAFDLAQYKEMAKQELLAIAARGHLPIICGGTGFYIQALVKDIDFSQASPSEAYRAELTKIAEEKGDQYLHGLLAEQDPAAAEAIHPNNRKRVIRALEFLHETGGKISEKNQADKEQESPYDVLTFFIDMDRQALYEKIDRRVDRMLALGLVEEVKALKEKGLTRHDVSMQGLGYKEILAYLDGDLPFEEAVRILKRDTRHFAKRQLTWFRRETDTVHLLREDFGGSSERIAEEIVRQAKEHFHI